LRVFPAGGLSFLARAQTCAARSRKQPWHFSHNFEQLPEERTEKQARQRKEYVGKKKNSWFVHIQAEKFIRKKAYDFKLLEL
jgi:hypothetical protein